MQFEAHPEEAPRNKQGNPNVIVLLSMSHTEGLRPLAEDDYRWLISGMRYLFEVDAQTPVQRSRLASLRWHVQQRVNDTDDRRPSNDSA